MKIISATISFIFLLSLLKMTAMFVNGVLKTRNHTNNYHDATREDTKHFMNGLRRVGPSYQRVENESIRPSSIPPAPLQHNLPHLLLDSRSIRLLQANPIQAYDNVSDYDYLETQFEEESNNTELFEGDIVPDFGEILSFYGEDVVNALVKDGMVIQEEDDQFILEDVITHTRWNNRVSDVVEVPYTIGNEFSSSERAVIENAIYDLEERSGVIRFVPRTVQNDYISIFSGSGCFSVVGRQQGEQKLSLRKGGCVRFGTVQHEFLHALGFWHEQNRPDRDNFVAIRWENIQHGKGRNFYKQLTSNTLGVDYDYDSIMHYHRAAFSRNGLNTIDAPQPTGQRTIADEEDILQLRLLYQCASGFRTLAEFNANRCTSDCKCWRGEMGCTDNDDACQGNLVCKNNHCQPTEPIQSFVELRSEAYPGYCLDAKHAKTHNGNPVWLYTCNGTPAQQWHLDPNGLIRSALDENMCMVPGTDASNNDNIVIWECGSYTYMRWTQGSNGNIYTTADNTRCIDIDNEEAQDGDPNQSHVQIWDCNGSQDKVFTVVKPFTEFRSIGFPDFCLDLKHRITDNGNPVWLYTCNGTPAQHWYVDANGLIRSAVDENKCIVPANDASNGDEIVVWDCGSFKYMYWGLGSNGNIYTTADNSKCIDIRNQDAEDGDANQSKLQIWECNGYEDKMFTAISFFSVDGDIGD